MYATPGCDESVVPYTPWAVFSLSKLNVSSTCNTATPTSSGFFNKTSPASFILEAVSSSTSSTIGIVHAKSLASLPRETTLSKSCCPKNPSKGLKIPSAIFSTSFAKSSEIVIENNPVESTLVILLTKTPPCALIELFSDISESLFMVYMKATLFVTILFPPPSTCTNIFTRFDRSSTRFTSYTWKTFVKKTIVR